MNSIRIRNVRSLKDTGSVELKKINMLVGKNSSGKSTFLRIFPLLKQSFYKRINGPILWSGDYDDYVDFGSFRETINKEANWKKIDLEFEIDYKIGEILTQSDRYRLFHDAIEKDSKNKKAILTISIANIRDVDIISNLKIQCDNNYLKINGVNNSINLNGKKLDYDINLKYMNRDNIRDLHRNVILDFVETKFDTKNIFDTILEKILKNKEEVLDDYIYSILMYNFLGDMSAKIFLNPNVENNKLFLKLLAERKEEAEGLINSLKGKLVPNIDINKFNSEETTRYLLMTYMEEVAKYCVRYLKQYFLNVNYIKPVRANAERYYRLRNLSIEQIDADGKNLPIFINSLNKNDLDKYNIWLHNNFDFKIARQTSAGHVSINIEKDGNIFNISDTGYGYSQILPIITQIWAILNKKNTMDIPIVFAIEQPELHLHPELQAKLIDVIAKVVEKENIQFILETHSDVMIDRIGNLIYKKYLDEKNVNVILFEKEPNAINTKVSMSNYNESGYLEKWPIGFFSADDIE